jgi:hypothetical protein
LDETESEEDKTRTRVYVVDERGGWMVAVATGKGGPKILTSTENPVI